MPLRDLLEKMDLPTAAVECPEWSTSVTVRGLSLAERTKVSNIAAADYPTEADRNTAIAVWMVIFGTLDADGTQAFTADHCEALKGKNPQVIDRLAMKIGELSKIGESESELEKNSEATQSGGSSSV